MLPRAFKGSNTKLKWHRETSIKDCHGTSEHLAQRLLAHGPSKQYPATNVIISIGIDFRSLSISG